MKTSSVLIVLLLMNSSFLAGMLGTQLLGFLNPYMVGGTELLLGVAYYAHTVVRDVRNCFNVDFKF